MKQPYRILALAPAVHELAWVLFDGEDLFSFAEVRLVDRSPVKVVRQLLRDFRPDLVVIRATRSQRPMVREIARWGGELRTVPLARAKKVVTGDGWASERHLRQVLVALFPEISAGRSAVVRPPLLSAVAVGLCEARVIVSHPLV
jgi:hypothetical protein